MERLTTTMAGEMAGVSPRSILRWIEAGHLAAVETPGGHKRITEADLQHVLRPAGRVEREGEREG